MITSLPTINQTGSYLSKRENKGQEKHEMA